MFELQSMIKEMSKDQAGGSTLIGGFTAASVSDIFFTFTQGYFSDLYRRRVSLKLILFYFIFQIIFFTKKFLLNFFINKRRLQNITNT